ncbi:MAG: hypothetical protein ACK5AO_07080, partial [bacterium]
YIRKNYKMSNNFIDLQTAIALTKRYRENKEKLVTPEFSDSMCIAETFDASAIRAVIDQPGCVAFRAYYGMKENKEVCVVFVGVNDKNEDIVFINNESENILVDWAQRCPPNCNEESPLMN